MQIVSASVLAGWLAGRGRPRQWLQSPKGHNLLSSPLAQVKAKATERAASFQASERGSQLTHKPVPQPARASAPPLRYSPLLPECMRGPLP